MNRKKKLNKILNARIKKMNAKKSPGGKEKYVSKAERAKLAALENERNAEVNDEQKSDNPSSTHE